MRVDETLNQLEALAEDAKAGFIRELPNLMTALAVLVVGWALARLLRAAVHRTLRRLSTKGARGPTAQAWQRTVDQHDAGRVAANVVYWLILVATFVIAVDALDIPLLRRWITVLGGFLPRLAIAVTLVVAGLILGRFTAAAIIETAYRLPAAQARKLARLAQAAIIATAALIAAGQMGLDVSLLTSVFLIALGSVLGGAALAFALGAREVMTDILAMHYITRAYEIGQVVRVGSDEGRIVRTTRTCIYLENAEGELSIPGRHFADSRCVLVTEEARDDA